MFPHIRLLSNGWYFFRKFNEISFDLDVQPYNIILINAIIVLLPNSFGPYIRLNPELNSIVKFFKPPKLPICILLIAKLLLNSASFSPAIFPGFSPDISPITFFETLFEFPITTSDIVLSFIST